MKKEVLEYLQQHPEFSIPALARTKKTLAEDLLSTLVGKHKDIVDAILPYISEGEANAIKKIQRVKKPRLS